MALFTKDPLKQLTTDLASKNAERGKLVARLADAVAAVDSATLEATQFAVDGADDRTLDVAEAKVRNLSDRVSTLKAALARLGTTIITIEREHAAALDKKTRGETAVTVEGWATRLEEIAEEIAPLISELADITAKASDAEIWDANGLAVFSKACTSQIPDGCGLVARSVREHAVRVHTGLARATLLQAAPPRATVAVAEPVVSKVFTTENVSWTDAQGQTRTAGKYSDIDLPVATAKRALASGICREIGGDLWRAWSGSRGFAHPDPSECTNLDSIAEVIKLNDAPIDAQFVRIDRGKPFEVSVVSRKA
jgi:hypothetical protein